MTSILDDAIGGFNTFLKTQQDTPGEAVMSVVLFDNEFELVHKAKPLHDIPPFNHSTFVPRGSTALLDAVGLTIREIGVRLAALPESERPNKVLFVILTDGHENASNHYTPEQINEMITHQRNVYKWEFLFLAANQDAFTVSERLGIARGNSLNFQASSDGTQKMYRRMSNASSYYRSLEKERQDVKTDNLFADSSDEDDEQGDQQGDNQTRVF
ncbi:vWA domain-containing protein [Rufibacter hautae]|nr:hypothetical protein [Rufibacter hautae]